MAGDHIFLGVDTSTPQGGVALVERGVVLAEIHFDGSVSPSQRLLPSIRSILQTAGLNLGEVAGLAVTVGPGSFTGIRVGLATVRGLAHATGRPVAGISTLRALAGAAGRGPAPVAAWLDAGRGEVYAALFSLGTVAGGEPESLQPEVAERPEVVLAGLPAEAVRFVGSGAQRWAGMIRERRSGRPDDPIVAPTPSLPAATARLGEIDLARGTALPPEPRYVRPPDALRARG